MSEEFNENKITSHTGERYGKYHAKPGNRSYRIIYQ